MKSVSILIGKYYGNITYWAVFSNRELAECQKRNLEFYDERNHEDGWEYFIQDEIIHENIS